MTRTEDKYYTVSAITNYISYKLSTDVALKVVYIKGEMSNCRFSKGHLYFVLKDTESEISGIIFANIAKNLKFTPKDGMKVLITGSITPYAKRGTYNLLVNEIIEFGEGYLYQQFLQLKDHLQKLGLFSEDHKKPIPLFATKIGVITSDTGDALNDIVSTITKRFPLAKVYLYKALVQGSDSPKSLIKALDNCEKDSICDVVIIGRGGGSFEDLNAFNDEALAKRIYDFTIPIVSGVGHENDYTICDFVCDERAPTPTGAAVRVTVDQNVLINNINSLTSKADILINKIITQKEEKFNKLTNNYYFKNFDLTLESKIQNINYLEERVKSLSPSLQVHNKIINFNQIVTRLNNLNIENKLDDSIYLLDDKINFCHDNLINLINNYEISLNHLLEKLVLVNPFNIMRKGYTLVYKDDKLVKSIHEINKDDELNLTFEDGFSTVKVVKINKNKNI